MERAVSRLQRLSKRQARRARRETFRKPRQLCGRGRVAVKPVSASLRLGWDSRHRRCSLRLSETGGITVTLARPMMAESIGTFRLVVGGCGSPVLAASFPNVGIGLLGVSFAFGLTVLTMAYAIGHISGCHLNPAVSIGLWAGRRFPTRDLAPYIVAQVVGAIVGAGVLYLIASGKA